MSEHQYEIIPGGETPKLTYSVLVQPPIVPGEEFLEAVLGRGAVDIKVSHFVTTHEKTCFRVEIDPARCSGVLNDHETEKKKLVNHLAGRIIRLANNPSLGFDLSQQSPFAC